MFPEAISASVFEPRIELGESSCDDLFIDGVAIDMEAGEQMMITQRGGSLLEATLRDGQFLDLVLNDSFVAGQDFIANGTTLKVIGVPEPSTPVLAGLFVTIVAAGIGRRREQRQADGSSEPAAKGVGPR